MTTAEMVESISSGYITVRRESSYEADVTDALARAALHAAERGTMNSYRRARQTLIAVRADVDHTYQLTDHEAREFEALVNLPDHPVPIDWESVYDDPDL